MDAVWACEWWDGEDVGRDSLLRGFEAKVLGELIEIRRESVDGECDGAYMEMQIVSVPFVH